MTDIKIYQVNLDRDKDNLAFVPYDKMTEIHLEKNHVVPPSSQDVALCRYSVSGEVPL